MASSTSVVPKSSDPASAALGLIRRKPRHALSLALAGLGWLSAYLFLRSKTETVGQDLSDLFRLASYKIMFDRLMKSEYTVADMFAGSFSFSFSFTFFFFSLIFFIFIFILLETVAKYPAQPFLHFIAESTEKEHVSCLPYSRIYSFSEVDLLSNQVANWAIEAGIKQQEVVALMIDNRPEMVWVWLGLAKAGAIIALINTHLTGHPLSHSLTISTAKHFLIGSEHVQAVSDVKKDLKTESAPVWYSYGEDFPGFVHLDPLLRAKDIAPSPRLKEQRRGMNLNSTLFYIYTSGTTGPPKASIVKHFRFYGAGFLFSKVFNVTHQDRIYCTLPMYHASGGMIGCGLVLLNGATLIFRKKFSAKRFWYDCAQFNASIMLYIGELCRYLVNSPESPSDASHSLRLAIGNGLRPDVWEPFVQRFNIPQIGEFYASTEGNANMVNQRNRFGAVGYISPLMHAFYPVKIVKFDVDSEDVIRGPDGLCIECPPGEAGELLGKIEEGDPTRDFSGYTNKQASEKKILSGVFVQGDRWFRTGDLLRRDASGFYHFVDRVGDTFRWKGENVATSEVSEIVSLVPGVLEANIYGVQVPHHDGHAGMASLVVDPSFSFDKLFAGIQELPVYARPYFARLSSEIDITGTFKHKKHTLVVEGFNPALIKDPLFFRDDLERTFVPLTQALYEELQRPNSRL